MKKEITEEIFDMEPKEFEKFISGLNVKELGQVVKIGKERVNKDIEMYENTIIETVKKDEITELDAIIIAKSLATLKRLKEKMKMYKLCEYNLK